MKKNLFLGTCLVFFGAIFTANAQTVILTGTSSTDGNNSVHIGTGSGNGTSSTGGYNTFVGFNSGNANTTAGFNSFFGVSSGSSNTLGQENLFSGFGSGSYNTTGNFNVLLGSSSGNRNNGTNNVCIGRSTGFWNVSGNENVYIGAQAGFNSTGGKNVFLGYFAGYNETGSEKLYIDNSLTSTPLIWGDFAADQLKLNGNVEVNSNGTNTSGLKFTDLTSAFTPAVTNTKFLTVNSTGDVVLENIASDINIYANDGTLTSNRIVTMSNKNLIFNTSGNTKTTGGRIYIGNTTAFTTANFQTTTGDYRLYVEGGVLTEKVKVALVGSGNWADYVFANDYKLMPLTDVESFVKANKHLPGVSSADNLVKEGLDLGAMQAKQMQKIEELTLYAIEQNKTIEKQSKEIEELKVLVNALVNKNK